MGPYHQRIMLNILHTLRHTERRCAHPSAMNTSSHRHRRSQTVAHLKEWREIGLYAPDKVSETMWPPGTPAPAHWEQSRSPKAHWEHLAGRALS
ncbi:hypothetical protein AAFF_G00056350 [Aldrovandia affinis]|uniref:Uncharacterized protein n=1 Tax=Aldrovandia affinis TaxID=143900 RepID=A0AAD7S381_9TELE|nr:hypothetical protein AAFF_G00056350 [Aldrovandia affinis]